MKGFINTEIQRKQEVYLRDLHAFHHRIRIEPALGKRFIYSIIDLPASPVAINKSNPLLPPDAIVVSAVLGYVTNLLYISESPEVGSECGHSHGGLG